MKETLFQCFPHLVFECINHIHHISVIYFKNCIHISALSLNTSWANFNTISLLTPLFFFYLGSAHLTHHKYSLTLKQKSQL